VLPVAMGGTSVDDYVNLAPPDSFVHVEDFESPQELGDYLQLMDDNDTLYNRSFIYEPDLRRI
jgi:glycoprotein 3-alpha-L-fucosyltransferase